jgi:tetratricopeptide (TPR) repeat protein
MSYLLRSLCFLPLLLAACSAPPPRELPPASRAEALLRLRAQADQLRPHLEAARQGRPLPQAEPLPAAPADTSTLSEAKRLVAGSPDTLNRLAAALMPGGNLPEPARRAAIRQLRQTLRRAPQLDLGWAWLGSLQAADRQLSPDTAIRSLDRAIDYNQQVGLYFKLRAKLNFTQQHYEEAVRDYQAAIARYSAPRDLYKELAAVYAMRRSDQLVTQTWEWVLYDIRRQLPGVQQRHARDPLGRDSVRLLQEEMGSSYLARGLYFINSQRRARGCLDLERAAAAGARQAPALQQQYCR